MPYATETKLTDEVILSGSFSPPTETIREARQAYQILHMGFTLAPILAGIDKFLHWLVNWD